MTGSAQSENRSSGASSTLDLNAATAHELARLPGIGPKLAEAIVAHRDTFGNFRRIENVMLVDGMSTKRYNEIRGLIHAEQQTDADK